MRSSFQIQFIFLLSVKHISNAHFVKDIYLYENIFVYILIQLKGGPSFYFQYTFSIKYGITCPLGPFTTFKHYGIISCFQYQNIYKTKSKFVQKVSNIFHECMVRALLQLHEALTLTLNRCGLFLRTCSLGTCAMIKQRAKHFMPSGSIHFFFHFILIKSCIFLNQCLCIIFFQ